MIETTNESSNNSVLINKDKSDSSSDSKDKHSVLSNKANDKQQVTIMKLIQKTKIML
ncbi:MAG: hypothetical protein V8S33_00420 [Intestinibacter bartlettii]